MSSNSLPRQDVTSIAQRAVTDTSTQANQVLFEASIGNIASGFHRGNSVPREFGNIDPSFGNAESVQLTTRNGKVTEALAANGARVNYSYDNSGAPQSIEVKQGGYGLTLTRGENGEWMRARWVSGPFGTRFQTHQDTVRDVTVEGNNGFSYRDGNATVFRGNNGHLQESSEKNGASTVTNTAPNGAREVVSTGPGGSVKQLYGPDGQIHEVARNSNDGTSEKLQRDANGRWTREFGMNGESTQFKEQLHDVQFDTENGSSYTYRSGGPNGPLVRQHINGNREIDYGGGQIRYDYSPSGQLEVNHTDTTGRRERFTNTDGTWSRETFDEAGRRLKKEEIGSLEVDPMGGFRYSHGERATTLQRNGMREDRDVGEHGTTTVTRESNGNVRSIFTQTADGRDIDLRVDPGAAPPPEGQPDNRWSIAHQPNPQIRDRVTDFRFDAVAGTYSYTMNGQRFINGSPEQREVFEAEA